MNSSEEILQSLFSKTTQGIRLGLDRMTIAANRLNNPQNAYPSIHVAGTNGKGSVCAYLESVLRHSGCKTGLFTSPHIVLFEERFCINGKPIATNQWMDVYRDLEPLIIELGMTFFEATTLIAFELFKREKVEYAVFETGMGGRLDSTNIVQPKVSVITHIDMDHTEFLGDTLDKIALEKLGIVKKDIPLVMAKPALQDICATSIDTCKSVGTQCVFADPADARDIVATSNNTTFTYNNHKFILPLAGSHQVENAIVAIKSLQQAGFDDLSKIAHGFLQAYLPGRFQVMLLKGKTIVFDVGHNAGAVRSCVMALREQFSKRSICIVAGIMKDKDVKGMIEQYCAIASTLYLTVPAIERSASLVQLRQHVPETFTGKCMEIPQVSDAVAQAIDGDDDVICVSGSFHTVGESMVALGVNPYP